LPQNRRGGPGAINCYFSGLPGKFATLRNKISRKISELIRSRAVDQFERPDP
jgi:hypothetical protein